MVVVTSEPFEGDAMVTDSTKLRRRQKLQSSAVLLRRHTCAEVALCLCVGCARRRGQLIVSRSGHQRECKANFPATIHRGLNVEAVDGSLQGIDEKYVARCLLVKPSQVVTWSVRRALAAGENFASCILRVRAQLAGRPRPTSFIVKRLPEEVEGSDGSGGMRQIVQEVGMWQREVDAYCTVIPAIEKLVGCKLTPALLPGPDPSDICLEDLRESGFNPADRRRMLDFEHSVVALEALAKFHAGSVAARQIHKKGKSVEEELFFKESRRKAAEDFMRAPFLYLAQDLLNSSCHRPELQKYIGPLRHLGDKIFDMLIQVSKPLGPFNVLNHGDFWTNNILFRHDTVTGEVLEAKIIDFQNCRYTTPALDLQYFLMSSVNEHVRETLSNELVDCYLQALNKQLLALGLPTLQKDVLERDMAATECYSLYCATAVLATVINDPGDFYCGATVPSNMDSLNPFVKCMRASSYRRMVPRLLEWFDRRGVFDNNYWPPVFNTANDGILA
ncbi:hypothetical protein LSTR_LSTR006784 [Laodelphax striatellus]|uniref:CHK kinase-like domain-containing protein n=1 Tax=Laodelphax striatellus TaxID=195883 RepID=A0A482WRN2_LAOST|nr:hypothetical protein LSTR_LSTR006784 [Laodelphax striatellus]